MSGGSAALAVLFGIYVFSPLLFLFAIILGGAASGSVNSIWSSLGALRCLGHRRRNAPDIGLGYSAYLRVAGDAVKTGGTDRRVPSTLIGVERIHVCHLDVAAVAVLPGRKGSPGWQGGTAAGDVGHDLGDSGQTGFPFPEAHADVSERDVPFGGSAFTSAELPMCCHGTEYKSTRP